MPTQLRQILRIWPEEVGIWDHGGSWNLGSWTIQQHGAVFHGGLSTV